MRVTYEVGDEDRENDFSREFCHLRNRLFRLNESLVFFLVRGETHGIVYRGFDTSAFPRFIAATFEAEEAKRYESVANDYLSKPSRKCPPEFPLPKFDVELTVDFRDGNTETYVFPYGTYSEKTLLEFCQTIRRSVNKFKNLSLYGGGL